MKIKVIKTRKIVESWVEKNGKIIEVFPNKETEYTEKEIEQESYTVLFKDGAVAEISFPESKIAYCSKCSEQKKIISLIKYTRNGKRIDGFSDMLCCSGCSLNLVKDFDDVENPEALGEIKEEINYKERV